MFLLICVISIICLFIFYLLYRYIKKRIYIKSIQNLKYKYSVGDKIVYRQRYNGKDRMIGCEIIERRYSTDFKERKEPLYKLIRYSEDRLIITLPEYEISCLSSIYGDFPIYDKHK